MKKHEASVKQKLSQPELPHRDADHISFSKIKVEKKNVFTRRRIPTGWKNLQNVVLRKKVQQLQQDFQQSRLGKRAAICKRTTKRWENQQTEQLKKKVRELRHDLRQSRVREQSLKKKLADLVNQPKRLSKKRAATTSNYEKDQHVTKKTKGSRETICCRFDKNEKESAITETYHAETVNKQLLASATRVIEPKGTTTELQKQQQKFTNRATEQRETTSDSERPQQSFANKATEQREATTESERPQESSANRAPEQGGTTTDSERPPQSSANRATEQRETTTDSERPQESSVNRATEQREITTIQQTIPADRVSQPEEMISERHLPIKSHITNVDKKRITVLEDKHSDVTGRVYQLELGQKATSSRVDVLEKTVDEQRPFTGKP